MTPDIILQAKECRSPEELLALARENGYDMTAEEAEARYTELHAEGELSDDELDSTVGGSCYTKGGRMIVTVGYKCDHWNCKKCGAALEYRQIDAPSYGGAGYAAPSGMSPSCGHVSGHSCNSCKYMSYEGGKWLCNHPENSK